MEYLAYKSVPNSGLCHMIMGIIRTVDECIHRTQNGSKVTLVLEDLQTRTSTDSIDFDVNFAPIPYDAIINVEQLQAFLQSYQIEVKRAKEINYSAVNILYCERYLVRPLSAQEHKNIGLLAVNHIPFNKKMIEISRWIMQQLDQLSQKEAGWSAFHLRIEEELINKFYFGNTNDVKQYRNDQLAALSNNIESFMPDPVVYIAHGLKDENYSQIKDELSARYPAATITTKKELLSEHNELYRYIFESCSLEEQAFLDWLVCMQAPHFTGIHYSSFPYMAAYYRHYKGVPAHTTKLLPPEQWYWDHAFARV